MVWSNDMGTVQKIWKKIEVTKMEANLCWVLMKYQAEYKSTNMPIYNIMVNGAPNGNLQGGACRGS